MKKLLFSTMSLIMVFVASGCDNLNILQFVKGKEQEEVTLRISWWGEQPRHDYTLKVIDLFEQKYPHINVESDYAYWDDYWQRLAPLAVTKQLPDIIQMDLLYLRTYSENNTLEDLTPFVEDGVIGTGEVSKDILSGGKIDDHLYGIPLGLNVPAIVVDREQLISAVGTMPNTDWTWDEYEDIAAKVHEKLGIYGTNEMKSVDVFFSYYLTTLGESLYNDTGNGLGYEDDQLFIDYFNMQLRLLDKGAFPRADVTEKINGIEYGLFMNKLTPMTWAYSNQYISFSEATERDIALIPPPGRGQAEGLSLKTSMLFSVPKSSKNKHAAAQFIDFFINDVEANKMIKGERGVPISSAVVEQMADVLSDDQKKMFEYVESVKNNNYIVEMADPLGATEVVNLLQDISNQILFKHITPSDGAEKFRIGATNILETKSSKRN